MKKHFTQIIAALCGLALILCLNNNATSQVIVTGNTNTIPNLAANYATLATAITAVNATTSISGPVTISQQANETGPLGGYSITAAPTGISSSNSITFQGNGFTITAFNPQAAGSLGDAIFKIVGADWITIAGFIMQENPLNTTFNPVGSNNMTEWGVALLRGSATDGAKNNTIQGNTISLNRSYANTFGIYSNVEHAAGTPTSGVSDITNVSGSNANNKIYGNIISNVMMGITFIGSRTSAFQDAGNDIGGSSAATGNTFSNWGGAKATSNYTLNSATSYCILMNHQTGENVSFNTMTSASVTPAVPIRGIYKEYSTGVPVGTFTTNINNNTITIASNAVAQVLEVIRSEGMTALSTATININNNTILNCSITGAAASVDLTGIINASIPGTLNINTNIFRGNSTSGITGGFAGISNTGAVVNSISISNNHFGDANGNAITFTAANSATIDVISNTAAAATASLSIQNNDFQKFVHNSASTSAYDFIYNTAIVLNENISGNTWTNISLNANGIINLPYT